MPEKNADCRCPTVQHYHGTHQCYRSCGCRKQECRDAHAAAKRHLTRQQAYGRSGTHQVDSHLVRKHVRKLTRKGWGTRAISAETGVTVSVINKLAYGVNGVQQPTVRADSAAKILAFAPEPRVRREKYEGTSIELTDATGSHRRLQALVTLGFSLTALAEYAGYGRSYFKDILAAERLTLTRAKIVSDLYDQLWNMKPIPETRAQKQSVTMAKRIAAKNGWYPPMAWDDDNIDNPAYKAWGQREAA